MEGEEGLGMTRIGMSTLNLCSGNQCEWSLLLLPLWLAPLLSSSAAGSGHFSGSFFFSTSSPCPAL